MNHEREIRRQGEGVTSYEKTKTLLNQGMKMKTEQSQVFVIQ